jgi:hypothetical protein
MSRLFPLLSAGLAMAFLALQVAHSQAVRQNATALTGQPEFTSSGELKRPQGYRHWVYLSSGYGMSYSQAPGDHLNFTNVFVTPASYDYFVQHGTWPDKTMFVLEIYASASKGSINKHGNYQSELVGMDVEVKDASRFPDKWAYFGFDNTQASATATKPSRNDCWKCHDQNAAIEHSFVQFYPELLRIAKEKGTIKPGLKL